MILFNYINIFMHILGSIGILYSLFLRSTVSEILIIIYLISDKYSLLKLQNVISASILKCKNIISQITWDVSFFNVKMSSERLKFNISLKIFSSHSSLKYNRELACILSYTYISHAIYNIYNIYSPYPLHFTLYNSWNEKR